MIQKILVWLSKVAVGKQLLGLVNGINEKLTGKRSEVLIGLQAILYLLGKFGVIPPQLQGTVDALSTGLFGAIPITLAEKLKNAQGIADQVIPAPTAVVPPLTPPGNV